MNLIVGSVRRVRAKCDGVIEPARVGVPANRNAVDAVSNRDPTDSNCAFGRRLRIAAHCSRVKAGSGGVPTDRCGPIHRRVRIVAQGCSRRSGRAGTETIGRSEVGRERIDANCGGVESGSASVVAESGGILT